MGMIMGFEHHLNKVTPHYASLGTTSPSWWHPQVLGQMRKDTVMCADIAKGAHTLGERTQDISASSVMLGCASSLVSRNTTLSSTTRNLCVQQKHAKNVCTAYCAYHLVVIKVL